MNLPDLPTPGERLKWAITQAGYASTAAFARSCDLPETSIRSHTSGSRNFTAPRAKAYGKKLGVPWQWLMCLLEGAQTAQTQTPQSVAGWDYTDFSVKVTQVLMELGMPPQDIAEAIRSLYESLSHSD